MFRRDERNSGRSQGERTMKWLTWLAVSSKLLLDLDKKGVYSSHTLLPSYPQPGSARLDASMKLKGYRRGESPYA